MLAKLTREEEYLANALDQLATKSAAWQPAESDRKPDHTDGII
jgi:hypothetical protein